MSDKHTKILRIYNQKLKYFNYSKNTIEIYSHYTDKFLSKVNKYTDHITGADFQTYLNDFDFTSISQQNQVISAIKFFYDKVLQRKYGKVDFKRPRKIKQLPKVIDKNHLKSSILSISNLKHKVILALAYSVGLRVSEVINLKIKDIDSDRMMILIKSAKGNKDRYVPLSPDILVMMRRYYTAYKPITYLFNGQKGGKYSATSCNQLVKKYIGKQYHFHQLRHSAFTSLIESGVDTRIIQQLAGHSSIKTTEIYTHISNHILTNLPLAI